MIQDAAPEPGKKQALALSIGVHLLLVLALFLGVQWKTEHAAVEVELWSDIPRTATSLPPPVRAPKPPPPIPETAPEPRPVVKADIVVKDEKKKDEKPPLEDKKPAKPDLKEMQKQAADEDRLRRQAAQEAELQKYLAQADAERLAASRENAKSTWSGKIKAKVRGNIVLPPGVQGNPEAFLKVTLLPTGEVLTVSFIRSSGNPALDAAIERAFLKSSPLPKPDDPTVFDRNLEITYRPFD